MSSKTKAIVYGIGVLLIGIYSFVISPVVVYTGLAEGAQQGTAPTTDWVATLGQSVVYLLVWTLVWGIVSVATPKRQL